MTKERTQIAINKLVGRVDGAYYIAEYAFDDTLHGKPFRGVTGFVLQLIPKEEYAARTDPENIAEYLEEAWRESVAARSTDLGLTEWAAEAHQCDGDDLIFDLSYYTEGEELIDHLVKIGEIERDDYAEFCECSGGGRCFGAFRDESPLKFDHVYDNELLENIDKAENGDEFPFKQAAEGGA